MRVERTERSGIGVKFKDPIDVIVVPPLLGDRAPYRTKLIGYTRRGQGYYVAEDHSLVEPTEVLVYDADLLAALSDIYRGAITALDPFVRGRDFLLSSPLARYLDRATLTGRARPTSDRGAAVAGVRDGASDVGARKDHAAL